MLFQCDCTGSLEFIMDGRLSLIWRLELTVTPTEYKDSTECQSLIQSTGFKVVLVILNTTLK